MKVLVLKSSQSPVVEEFFYIGSPADEQDARDELRREGFRPHSTIPGRWEVARNGRKWEAYFKDVGDTAISWHLLNTPPVHGAPGE